VYVAALVTVIVGVVAPLLHSSVPVKLLAVKSELPQLLVTVTVGAVGVGLTVNVAAFEFAEPALFVHTARYCFPLSPVAVANVSVALIAPMMFDQLIPLFVLTCHCTIGAGAPLAADIKVTLFPEQIVCVVGCVVTEGAVTGAAQLIAISFNTGVKLISGEARVARYCIYLEVTPTGLPDAAIVVNPDQVTSGTAVFPVLAAIVTLVPAGKSEFQEALPQALELPASKTREVNVPDAA